MSDIYAALNSPFGGVVAAIFVVCIFVAWRNWKPYLQIKSQLTSINTYIDKNCQNLDQDTYNKLSEAFESKSVLKDEWREFTETVIIEDNSETPKIWNTQQADHFFDFETIVASRVSVGLIESLPGIITGIGLLGTFVALYWGLHGLQVGLNSEVKGIDHLINNLAAKFLSSIAGVGVGVVAVILEKNALHSLEKRCQGLQNRLNKLFPRVVSEDILLKILHEAREQTAQLKNFNSDMSSTLKKGLEESMQPTMNRMIDSIEKLSSMTDQFHQKSQPTSEQILSSIDKLTTITEEAQQHQGDENTSALEKIASTVSEKLSSGANAEITNLSAALTRAGETMSQMTESMSATAKLMEETLGNQMRNSGSREESINTSISGLLEKLNYNSATYLDQMNNASKDASRRLEDHLNSSLAAMRDQQQQSLDQNRQQQEELKQAVDNLISNISSSASNQVADLEMLSTSLIAKLNQSAETMTKNLENTADKNTAQTHALHEANQALSESISSINAITKDSHALIDNWKSVTREIDGLTKHLSQSSSQIRQTQELGSKATSEFSNQFSRYDQSMRTTEALWQRQKELHEWLDNNVGKLLGNVNTAMIKFQEHTHKTLGNSLTDFDGKFADAIGRFSARVDDLDEKFDELTNVIDKTAQRIAK